MQKRSSSVDLDSSMTVVTVTQTVTVTDPIVACSVWKQLSVIWWNIKKKPGSKVSWKWSVVFFLNALFQNTAVTNIETGWNTNEYRKETKVNWNT